MKVSKIVFTYRKFDDCCYICLHVYFLPLTVDGKKVSAALTEALKKDDSPLRYLILQIF